MGQRLEACATHATRTPFSRQLNAYSKLTTEWGKTDSDLEIPQREDCSRRGRMPMETIL